jgi:uncharacterized membrane protein
MVMATKAAATRSVFLFVVAAVIVGGCVARFVDLDRHFYFHDEAATSLNLSGHTPKEFERRLAGRTQTISDTRPYQHVGDESGISTIVHHLAQRDPQHPPLFYVLARLWAEVAGDSIASLRAFAAILSLLALPCIFWLGRELFSSAHAALIAVAFAAVSPFQLLYAQEAREYGLWSATVALASAALLFALRRRTWPGWVVYGLCLTLMLYTFTLSLLVFGGQLLYVVARRLAGAAAPIGRFVLASAVALLAFSPWVLAVARNRGAFEAGTDWTRSSVSFGTLARSWLVVLADGVVDKRGDSGLTFGVTALLVVVVAIQVTALAVLWRSAPRRAAQFLSILAAASFLPLAVPDLVVGGQRSTVQRFLVPTYLGLTLALAFLVFAGLRGGGRRRLVASVLAAGVVACGAGSYTREVGARVWWNQDDGAAAENRAVADVLNQQHGVFLMATGGGALLELTNYLRPDTRVRLVLDGRPPSVPRETRYVFAYGSPASPVAAERLARLLANLRRRSIRVEPVEPPLPCCGGGIPAEPDQFWRVTQQP